MRPVAVPEYVEEYSTLQSAPAAIIGFVQKHYAKLYRENPEVSIIIPAYNEEKIILQTLASLAANITSWSVEIIVVNNNSTDNTEALVKSAGILCITETKKGITAARNAGLHAARGKYILNADADAIYPPGWIQQMVQPLASNKQIALTYGRFSFIPVGSTLRIIYFFYEYAADVIRLINKYFKEEAVNVYGFNSAFRRAQGVAVEGFDHPPGSNEDGWLALKLRTQGFGKLHYVTDKKALVWTTDRRMKMDGGLIKGVIKRITKLFFPAKQAVVRADL